MHLNHFKDRHRELFESPETEKRLLELSALFEISQTLNSSLDLKAILDNILLVPMGRMLISRGIILFGDSVDNYDVQYFKGLPEHLFGQKIKISKLPETPLKLSEYKKKDKWTNFFKEQKLELIIPFASQRNFKGLIAYGRKLTGMDFSEDEIEFLNSLTNIAVQSIENARFVNELNQTNHSLDLKIQELNTLFEIGKELNLLFDPEDILKQLSYALMGQMLTNRFFVTLSENDNFKIVLRKGMIFNSEKLADCTELCRLVSKHIKKPSLCKENNKISDLLNYGIQVVVPMQVQNDIAGYIFLGQKMNGQTYSHADLDFLSTLANMVIIALENARLIEQRIEKERLEEELTLARSIQDRLLPSKMPEHPNFNIHGINIPSKLVGGDYFDIIPFDDKHYILTIADVSGKGMPAALLMSNLQAGLQMLCIEQKPLAEITAKLNNLIYRNTSIDKFITFFILKLNITDGSFEYVNAGHNPPYLFSRDGSFLELEKGGLILGMMPDLDYEEGQGALLPNGCLAMFTDGVTEAMNGDDDFFDEHRVISFFQQNFSGMDSDLLNKQLIKDVEKFSGGNSTNDDDITLLTVKRIE